MVSLALRTARFGRRLAVGLVAMSILGLSMGAVPAQAATSNEKYCATLERLAAAGRLRLDIVPEDTAKVGIAKLDRFKSGLSALGKSGTSATRSLVLLVISDLVRMRADLVGASKNPRRTAPYVASFQLHSETMNLDMDALNDNNFGLCGGGASIGSQPTAPAESTTIPATPATPIAPSPAVAAGVGGRTASTGGYTITVNSILRNANDEVKRIVDVGVFNLYSPAPAGRQYVIVEVTITWTGPGNVSPAATLGGFLSPTSVVGSDSPWTFLGDSTLFQAPFVPPSSLQVPKGTPQAYRWLFTVDSNKIDQARYLVFSDNDVTKAVSVALP
jgi:hypothetical protein